MTLPSSLHPDTHTDASFLRPFVLYSQDESYQAYFDNADTYKRQVEERYPLACKQCLGKVHEQLAQQNYQIKSSLLNATLSKSRGIRIYPTRKYPTVGWLLAGSCWILAHATLSSVEIVGTCPKSLLLSFQALFFIWSKEDAANQHILIPSYGAFSPCLTIGIAGHSFFPIWRLFTLPKYLARTADAWTLKTLLSSMLNVLTAVLPWSSSFGQLSIPSEAEQTSLMVVTLAILSVAGLNWNPLEFAAQRSPRTRIRTRQYFRWAQVGAFPLIIAQFIGLFTGLRRQNSNWVHWVLSILHALYLVTFLNGQYIQEPLDVRLDGSGTHTPTLRTSTVDNASQNDPHKVIQSQHWASYEWSSSLRRFLRISTHRKFLAFSLDVFSRQELQILRPRFLALPHILPIDPWFCPTHSFLALRLAPDQDHPI